MRCLRYGAKGKADLRTARKLIDEYRDDLYNAGKGGSIMAKKHTFMCPECKTRYECIGTMLKHRCEKCGAELVAEEVPVQQTGKKKDAGDDCAWANAVKAMAWVAVVVASLYGFIGAGIGGLIVGLLASMLAVSGIMMIADMARDIRRIRKMMEEDDMKY